MDKRTMEKINVVALWLMVIGSINWGLVAFDFNLVQALGLGDLTNWVYGLVGLAGAWFLYVKFAMKKMIRF